jgi:adenine-specific DNA-methyltransferase
VGPAGGQRPLPADARRAATGGGRQRAGPGTRCCRGGPGHNQHKYLGNYHIWESLVRWDKPEVYGTACKRADCRTRQSDFNSKPRFAAAFAALVAAVRAPWIVLSFNDEGFLTREAAEALLATRGEVTVIERDYPRYVGARIGIHNPAGEKVGRVQRLRNREYLFVAGPERVRPSAHVG